MPDTDYHLQIVGEIRAARNALVQVTAKLRSYLYRDICIPNDMLQASISGLNQIGSLAGRESNSPPKCSPRGESKGAALYHHKQTAATSYHSKVYLLSTTFFFHLPLFLFFFIMIFLLQ